MTYPNSPSTLVVKTDLVLSFLPRQSYIVGSMRKCSFQCNKQCIKQILVWIDIAKHCCENKILYSCRINWSSLFVLLFSSLILLEDTFSQVFNSSSCCCENRISIIIPIFGFTLFSFHYKYVRYDCMFVKTPRHCCNLSLLNNYNKILEGFS